MDTKLREVLDGKTDNYILPFFWQHGDSDENLKEEIERIQECGVRALCVEARSHEEFGEAGWWEDMDLILSECDRRGMKVWLLDDKHFPTGYANGLLAKKDRRLRKWEITERHLDVCGSVHEGAVLADAWLEDSEDKILAVLACEREKEGEKLTGNVIDLTDKLADGLVYVTLPEGVYRIIFLLQTRRDIPERMSLYCDQLSEESMDVLIEAVYETHWEHYKRYFGNTFVGFFSDEPCFGNGKGGQVSLGKRFGSYPWREEMVPLLREEYQENPYLCLPALWFDMEPEFTAKVRIGYMNVITRLYQKNFSEKLGNWCREHNVSYIGHIIEDNNSHTKTGWSAGHYFRALEGQDMAGIDVVLHQIVPGLTEYETAGLVSYETMDSVFFHYVLAKLAASMAQQQPSKQGRAMCEIYGAYGWAEGVKMMKWLTDHMLVRGINCFVPHAFSPMFPNLDCPPHFYARGNNPEYRAFGELMRYANRMCHLLNGGTHVASCAILYQAEAEWSGSPYMPMQVVAKLLYDRQIDYEFVSGDYLVKAECEDARIKVGNQTFSCLVIPYAACLPFDIVKKSGELSEEGGLIWYVDSFPEYFTEGREAIGEEEISRWCSEGQNRYCVPLNQLVQRMREENLHEISLREEDSYLRSYLYIQNNIKYCMLFNENMNHVSKNKMKVKGFDNGWYGIYDGLENEILQRESKDGTIEVEIPPYQSRLYILDMDREEEIELELSYGEMTEVAEIAGEWKVSMAEEKEYPNFRRVGTFGKLCNMASQDRFPRFSGHFLYETDFEISENLSGSRWMIDLGAVGEAAVLTLNGRKYNEKIVPPYCYDVTKVLRQGENHLEIDVVSHMGYEQRDMFSKYLLMEPVGLLGPVKLKKRIDNM